MCCPCSVHSESSITSDTRCNSNPNTVVPKQMTNQVNELPEFCLNFREADKGGGGGEMYPTSPSSPYEDVVWKEGEDFH